MDQKIKLLALLLAALLALSLTGCGKQPDPPAQPNLEAPSGAGIPSAEPESAPAEPAPVEPEPEKPSPTERHPDPADFTATAERVNGVDCQRWAVRFFTDYTNTQFPGEGTVLFPTGSSR